MENLKKKENLAAIQFLIKRQQELQTGKKFQEVLNGTNIELDLEIKPFKAEEPTGDFVKLLKLGQDRTMILVGDIEGHGSEAAKFSMELHDLIESFNQLTIEETREASSVLELLDKNIVFKDRSLTLSCTIVNFKTGELQYANAGLPPLILKRRNGNLEKLVASGLYVGHAYSNFNSGTTKSNLLKGDTFIIMSDGVTEAMSKDNILMNKILLDCLQQLPTDLKPREIKKEILSKVDKFNDDATLLVFRWSGPPTVQPA